MIQIIKILKKIIIKVVLTKKHTKEIKKYMQLSEKIKLKSVKETVQTSNKYTLKNIKEKTMFL
jgi:hypothetical protein